jgi:hypothetical protein
MRGYRVRHSLMVALRMTRLMANFSGEVSMTATLCRAAPAKINAVARRSERGNLTMSLDAVPKSLLMLVNAGHESH